MSKDNVTKDERPYCTLINFFNPSNKPLKQLTEEEKSHIERHIPKATYLQFVASIERQYKIYKISLSKYSTWKTLGSKKSEFPGYPTYPCLDCIRIAKKLKLWPEKV